MNQPRWLDPNNPSYIWTIGYGISTEEEFIHRLKTAFPDGDAIIVDIRKKGSGSRNAGNWADWNDKDVNHPEFGGMAQTCINSGNDFMTIPELYNPHGNTIAGLLKYGRGLYIDYSSSNTPNRHLDDLVLLLKERPETKFCLMCCERKPFAGKFTPKKGHIGWSTWTGKENCHRITLARNIGYRMRCDYNLEWFTRHLYTERKT